MSIPCVRPSACAPGQTCSYHRLDSRIQGFKYSIFGNVQGFLASGKGGRGRRGGRGSGGMGRPGVNPPPGYENGFATGPAADSSAHYEDEEGSYARAPGYAEQMDGRGRGRAGRGRGRARSAVPINGQQAGDGYTVEVCTARSLAWKHGACQLQSRHRMP